MMPSRSSASGSLVTSSPMLVMQGAHGRSPPIAAVELAADLARGRRCVWTTRPSTITWTTSAAVAANTAVCSSAPVPAVRGRGGVEGDQVGAGARPRSRRRRGSRGWRGRGRCRRRAARRRVQWPRCWVRQPLVHLDRAHLLEQVDHRVAVAAQGQRAAGVVQLAARADPVAEVALGGRAEAGVGARSSPRWRMSSVGEVGGVHGGGQRAEDAVVGEQLRSGCAPYAARQASFSATCSERCTCSGRPSAASTTTGICSAGTARTEWIAAPITVVVVAAQLRGSGRPALRVAVGEAQLHALDRRPEPAAEVAGVEQRDPDPGLARPPRSARGPSRSGRRTACRRAGGAGSGTPRRGDPGRRHLAVGRPRQREVGVGVEPLRDGVHLLAPGPERAPRRAGSGPAAPGGTRGCGSSRGRGG